MSRIKVKSDVPREKNSDFLIIGGGLAGATAAETLRREGTEGSITIISIENHLPYHRPPLSKGFLLGEESEESLLVLPESFYREQNVEVALNTRATSVDPVEKVVTTNNGRYRYVKLLIATGCALKRLRIPGEGLSGVHYLRNISHARSLKESMKGAKRAVLVGSSFIAMELASTLTKAGTQTTIVAMEKLLFDRLYSPAISDFFLKYYREKGVEVYLGETVTEFRGEKSVSEVVTQSGRIIPCDIVCVGIGVTPCTEFLSGSGIATRDGVIVDEYLRTNVPDVFAAGDIAMFFDPVFRKHRRIEHWDNAVRQARHAARAMLGEKKPFRAVSYFFSDVFDYTFNFLGEVEGDEEQIVRGEPGEGSFSVFYVKDEHLKATFLLKRPITEYNVAGSLILNRVSLRRFKGRLRDTAQPLDKIPLQVVLVLQGGGALGAFECGVVKAMEERGIHTDIVAGISIGAFNAAIIASNPERAADAMYSFWEELAVDTPEIPSEWARRLASAWVSILFGNPSFFKPKWLMPTLTPPYFWKSLYDTSPVVRLLEKYVDFRGLKDSPVRLLVSAVNVETGELETWDSYSDDITPLHILASGSLPPALPWTTIDGRHYWDGGIVTNTPLNQVIELCGLSGKKVYIVNLYSKERALPRNMLEVLSRKDEIFYSEKVRSEMQTIELLDNFKKLVEELMGRLEPEAAEQIMHRPLYINTMGYYPPLSIVRITHEGPKWELPSKDFDFSRRSILMHVEEGYKEATRVLAEEEKKKHVEVKG